MAGAVKRVTVVLCDRQPNLCLQPTRLTPAVASGSRLSGTSSAFTRLPFRSRRAAEAVRYRAEQSSASLAGWKSRLRKG